MDSFVDTLWIGVAAQLLEGLLGFGYGATAASMLLACGMPPLLISASTHASEVTTHGVAALAHWRLGNINVPVWRRLAGFGLLGALCGISLALCVPATWLNVAIALYLLALGVYLLQRAWRRSRPAARSDSRSGLRGFFAGLLDAGGGGGWGAMTTAPLIASGLSPRQAIGSSHAAEFLLAASISFGLILVLGGVPFQPILGLMAGAVLAAPFAARLGGRLSPRVATTLVGGVVATLALWVLLRG